MAGQNVNRFYFSAQAVRNARSRHIRKRSLLLEHSPPNFLAHPPAFVRPSTFTALDFPAAGKDG